MPKTPVTEPRTPRKLRTEWIAIPIFLLAGLLAGAPSRALAEEVANEVVETAALAPATTESPEQTIEAFHAGLVEIMKNAKELGFQGRIDELQPLMDRAFDLDFMASKTVGRHWNKLSDEDKARWKTMFGRFTTANYAGRFKGYTGEEFITLGVDEAPRNTRLVRTKITVPNDDDVELNYRMIERNGEWKVVDVFLNGTVSELALRRSEYSAALKRDGFEQLLASVETKIKDLKTRGQADG